MSDSTPVETEGARALACQPRICAGPDDFGKHSANCDRLTTAITASEAALRARIDRLEAGLERLIRYGVAVDRRVADMAREALGTPKGEAP